MNIRVIVILPGERRNAVGVNNGVLETRQINAPGEFFLQEFADLSPKGLFRYDVSDFSRFGVYALIKMHSWHRLLSVSVHEFFSSSD